MRKCCTMGLLYHCHLVRDLQVDNDRAIIFKTRESIILKRSLGDPLSPLPLSKGNPDSSKRWQPIGYKKIRVSSTSQFQCTILSINQFHSLL